LDKKYSLLNKEYKFLYAPQLYEEDLQEYKAIFRHLQKNNKAAYGLFCARLHCHNTYIERLCSCYVASPGTKYPHKLCLVIFFQMPTKDLDNFYWFALRTLFCLSEAS